MTPFTITLCWGAIAISAVSLWSSYRASAKADWVFNKIQELRELPIGRHEFVDQMERMIDTMVAKSVYELHEELEKRNDTP